MLAVITWYFLVLSMTGGAQQVGPFGDESTCAMQRQFVEANRRALRLVVGPCFPDAPQSFNQEQPSPG